MTYKTQLTAVKSPGSAGYASASALGINGLRCLEGGCAQPAATVATQVVQADGGLAAAATAAATGDVTKANTNTGVRVWG